MSETEDHVIPESITRLWGHVQDALSACGDPSPREIDRLAASCGLRLPSSTVEGWFRTWSVVPSWEKFDALVKALGAEQDLDWKQVHASAQLADRQRKSDSRRHGGPLRPAPTDRHAEPNGSPPAEPPGNVPRSPANRPSEPGGLHVTAEVTHLPEIRARVTHILDHRSVILLGLGALTVLVVLAVALTTFAPSRSRATPPITPRAAALTPKATTPAPAPTPTATASQRPADLPLWPLPSESQLRKGPPSAPAGAPRVLYVGDQLATETRDLLAHFVHRSRRGRVIAADQPDTALCDRLADRPEPSSVPRSKKLPALVAKIKPAVIVLQVSGVSSPRTPCTGGAAKGSEDYHRRYLADARTAVRQVVQAARAAGIARPKLVWVLQGPDRTKPDRIRRLNEAFKTTADSNGDLVADAGWYVSVAASPFEQQRPGLREKWELFLPCIATEVRFHYCSPPEVYGGVAQLHSEGEFLRLCLGVLPVIPRPCMTKSPGATRYSQAIARTVIDYLTDTPPPG